MKRLLVAALWTMALIATAQAQDMAVAERLKARAEAGELGQAETELARGSDAQTIAALGMVRFARAFERFSQSLYRHGLRQPTELSSFMPWGRITVPTNPNPEPLTYEKLRAIYTELLRDLAAAEGTLARLPDGAVKLPLDLNAVRLDINGDARGDAAESLGALIAGMMGPPNRRRDAAPPVDSWTVGFDRADMFWLRGYCNLLSSTLEFVLAHDWRNTYVAAAHLFFAGAADPNAKVADPSGIPGLAPGRGAGQFADAIAFVHLARWDVAEPRRLLKSRDHLKAVITLSRQTWKEVRAETDDANEWLPKPEQQSRALPSMPIDDSMIDGWLGVLDEMEAVLDGKKLIPHWRYNQGIDLAAVFTSPRPFDLVLWVTGHAALPYLKDGPTVSQETWRRWQAMFRGNFLAYAAWIN